MADMSNTGLHCSRKMSRQIEPSAYTLGWKSLVMNFTFGAMLGYSSVNERDRVKVPPSHTVPAGPKMMACHSKILLSTGVPLIPSGGSVLSVIKSFFRRRFAEDEELFDEDDCCVRCDSAQAGKAARETCIKRVNVGIEASASVERSKEAKWQHHDERASELSATTSEHAPFCAAWPSLTSCRSNSENWKSFVRRQGNRLRQPQLQLPLLMGRWRNCP